VTKAPITSRIDDDEIDTFDAEDCFGVGSPQRSMLHTGFLEVSEQMPTFSDIADQLASQAIELPSWAFGNSGTRFKVFGSPGTPRTVQEKLADAAQVHEVTGLAPRVALHIPWDKVEDYGALRDYAAELGVTLGTINSNTFQDDLYKFGSLTHNDDAVRRKAIDHHFECIEIMNQTGSRDLKIWLADGTNYAGQGDIRGRQDRLADSLAQIYERIGPDQRLVLEYKFFEPAFYHTDVPDWGTSYAHVAALGDRAVVCLDTGHHAPGTNIEFIVAQLLRLGKLGSFDFNSRYYADDDLIVGSADPFQLFRILYEVVRGGGYGPDSDVAFMLDQCHNIEPKIPGQIRSVLNVQEMTARALLVDQEALATAQEANDVLGANGILMDAFYNDVRPALAEWRESRGLPADPMHAYAESGYQSKIESERAGGTQAGWGA
jgi:L-rhamnose isomerase / sugar isomerase